VSESQGLATRHACAHRTPIVRSITMLDVVLVAAALGFFALSIGYTLACDRL